MRVTDNLRLVTIQRSLAQARARHAELANQVASGQRVQAPSDDPVAAASLMRLSARAARVSAYQDTIGNVRGDVELTESRLAEASDLLARARELAVQGANGSLSAADRAALAREVGALREQLFSVANTRGQRGYIFAGSQTATPAFSDGVFQGDDAEHQVEVSPGVVARVSVSGSRAFGAAGGTDVFAVLSELEQALDADDGARVAGTLQSLEASREQIVRSRADAGLILNRLDSADEALTLTAFELVRSQAELGEVDAFAAISQLTQLTTTLEQAIAVARTTLNSGRDLF